MKKDSKTRLFEVMQRVDNSFKNIINENVFDRFNISVQQPNYQGTIKRTPEGWSLFDINDRPEEGGPFETIESLMGYYDIDKSQLSGDYVNNLNEDNNDKIGVSLRSLLDGELANAVRSIDLNNYNERNKFIDMIENRLAENDWISLSNGLTFEKSFTPSGR